MRKSLTAVLTGSAALLAAGLIFPAGAQAATVPAVPAPTKSLFAAGYEQLGCHHNAYPQYVQISGTIVVPSAAIHGAVGISSDVYSIGGINSGVVGGISVDNANGQGFYTAYAQWGYGAPVTAFPVHPGDDVQVTIENEGSAGWLVEIGGTDDGEFVQTNPDTDASPCVAGAYEQNDYPTHLTQTTPVAFDFSRVWWGEQGQPVASVSKLVGTPPAYAKLYRYNMVNSSGTVIAATSKPADSNNNFTVTDK